MHMYISCTKNDSLTTGRYQGKALTDVLKHK